MSQTIFNIIQSNAKGGMENIFLDYSQILKQNQFNLIAIVSKNFVHIARLKELNIQIEILNISGHFDIWAAIKLRFLIKKYQPNLIIAHNGRAFAALNLAQKLGGFKNIKLLAVSHGGSIKRILKFDFIIAVAKHIEEKIRAKNFSGLLQTIYNGIKIVPYKKARIADGSFNFGILSRLSPEKNIDLAINAFNKFSQANSMLIIAGEGPQKDELQKLSQNNSNIKFIGWITDKNNFFNEIDVFLQPSGNEPFGLTILEAFNYQTPVIAADNDGPKEIIKNNLTGYLFEKYSALSLLEAMENCYKNREMMDSLTARAYQDLLDNFSHQKMAENLLNFIKSLNLHE